ncbi:MAG: glycosyltransferase [Deltaproteobacteria bacterium]|nr:glycosyltransferase [Deltaproteobacteria bacterium]
MAPVPKTPIKVLQLLVTMPVGGAEIMVADIATGLDPGRFEVVTACLGEPGPMGEELRCRGKRVVSLGLDLKRTSTFSLVRRVRELLKEIRPDILHTHLYHANLYGRLAALGLGLPGVVATVHNIYSRVKWHRCLANYLLARVSDYVLVFSPQVRDDVFRFDRVPAARLKMLTPGVRLEEPNPGETREEIRSRLGISGFCVGNVARLEEQKGHEDLLAAVSKVRGEIPDLTVLLVGDGSRGARLRALTQDLGLGQVVRFLGVRRDIPRILQALDVFLMPSRWEGIPLTILEAMGYGLPVISTMVGRVPEIIQDGVNGRLTPVADPEALARAILELYREPGKRRQWGEQARRTVQEKYTLKHFLEQFAAIYLELYEKGRGH